MRYIVLFLLLAGTLSAQTATPLEVDFLTPAPATLGSDRDIVARQLVAAFAPYQITADKDDNAEFALSSQVHLNKISLVESTVVTSDVSLSLELTLHYVPTGELVAKTWVPLEGSDFSPARAHEEALSSIKSTHPQLKTWARALPAVMRQYLAAR